MGKPYSQDLRDRVLAAVDGGLKPGAVAELFHVDVSYVYKILIRRRTSGMTTALPWAGGPQPKLKGHHEVLRQHVSENCDATLAEIRTFLLAEHGIEVSVGCLWNALKQLKLPPQKKTQRATEQEREDIAEARRAWHEAQSDLNAARLVFIDETGAQTNMARRYGRAPRGQRLLCKVPWGHWKTITFVAALRCDGITAPAVFDGPMDGECFRAYVEQILAPTLSTGDIVIMDNLASHKVPGIKDAIEAAGAALRYLPPYSPDLNPIEQAIAKFKSHLRKEAARTLETLIQAIARTLNTFTPKECENYIRAAGYRHQL
ncbi:IS630 family transposase [Nordella sp. HKS 07]|uniref:IS630 family transposase n=1 Tax=Nordella sp. HKS 07 TaxID=2712222 RepID=UPI0013E17EA8|nr:IS630 family transposase [Nordella sp. HKS 07]QIG52629.1 IS630 family transposase [Nordella sp. HKS 07]QIG52704.1 IS630 family transposase [Nordella sp. HKS 07]